MLQTGAKIIGNRAQLCLRVVVVVVVLFCFLFCRENSLLMNPTDFIYFFRSEVSLFKN